MNCSLPIAPRRMHLTRLMSIWRSAGWPCRDAVELDLLAAGWASLVQGAHGHEAIRLTDAGIRLLAESRQRNQRSLSAHDRLAARVAAHLMSCETYYVLPAGVAEPREIPEAFGIWLLNGSIESGTLEMARPARHVPCKLPFQVWMSLAKATPARLDGESTQRELAETTAEGAAVADVAIDARLQILQAATGT